MNDIVELDKQATVAYKQWLEEAESLPSYKTWSDLRDQIMEIINSEK